MKRCSKCGQEKDKSEYHKNKNTKDGLCGQCKECRIAYNLAYQRKHKPWRARHERLKDEEWYKEQRRQQSLRYHHKARLDALEHYGMECVMCGYDNADALVMDHMDNDGTKHRKEMGWGSGIFTWLRKNDYPENFQVLCRNCNWLRHLDNINK